MFSSHSVSLFHAFMPYLSPMISSLLVYRTSNFLSCLNAALYIIFLEDQCILVHAPVNTVKFVAFYCSWSALRSFHYEMNVGFCDMNNNNKERGPKLFGMFFLTCVYMYLICCIPYILFGSRSRVKWIWTIQMHGAIQHPCKLLETVPICLKHLLLCNK